MSKSLFDLAYKKAASNDAKYSGKTTEEIVEQMFNQAQSKIRDLDKKIKILESKKAQTSNVGLTPTGQLIESYNIRDERRNKDVQQRNTLTQSEILADLSALVRPLLGVAKAYHQSGRIIHHTLVDGDKKPIKDSQGNQFYRTDPLSELKAICYILQHNKQAVDAIKKIKKILDDSTKQLESLKVTDQLINDTRGEVSPRFDISLIPDLPRSTQNDDTASSKASAEASTVAPHM